MQKVGRQEEGKIRYNEGKECEKVRKIRWKDMKVWKIRKRKKGK